MARQEFSKRTKRDAFVRANGRCEKCDAKLTPQKFAYDHVNPDGLTGEPTLENCMVLCDPCHKEKTRQDVKDIAQAKRREDAHRGIRKQSKLQGQGFAKALPQRRATTKVTKLEIAYRRREP
jgi:5-methylcytosine-specific restriction protein A